METSFTLHECSRCREPVPGDPPFTVSPCCQALLFSRYDFSRVREALPPPGSSGPRGVWRYRPVLPLPAGGRPVSLGEGGTPLIRATRLGDRLGIPRLLLKDESANPTGSFKDRGLSVAVSLAAAAGVPGITLPTAGNAGASAAAYGARAGIPVSVHSPKETPSGILAEIRMRGARLTLHPGSIAEAGRAAREESHAGGALDVATFREPGRVEGKKTMAYEIREDLGRVPDAVVYPCGGGTGIVALARAFDEMEALGWIGPERPRLYAVQSAACAPIVEAFRKGWPEARKAAAGPTLAAGLRVPGPFAHREILTSLRRSSGGAVAVAEEDIREAGRTLAVTEGILACPEGAAAVAGAGKLRREGVIASAETVVVFQTASGLKYLDAWGSA